MEAQVLFDYEKQQDDELDLKTGDVIINVTQVDDGWCQGTFQGQTGMFPDNFVQLRSVTVAPSTPAPASTPTKPSKPAPPDPVPPVIARPTGQTNKVRRAKVAFSYAAENPDEVSLAPGQTIEVLGEEEDGWWKGRVGDREGLFPSNFVEILEEETPPPDHTQPLPLPPQDLSDGPPPEKQRPPVGGVGVGLPLFNPLSVKLKPTPQATPPPAKKEEAIKKPELKKTPLVQKPPASKPPPALPPQDAPTEKAKVKFAYTPEQPDELEIKLGDVLEVVNKREQDGWWKVKLNEKVGLVPDNFVELLQPSELSDPPPPVKKDVRSKPPPPAPASDPSSQEHSDLPPSNFGVPPTEPLDNSAVKERAQRPIGVRPPSRSNLHSDDPEPPAPEKTSGGGEAPWQKEMKKRRKKEPVKLPPPKPSIDSKKPAPPHSANKPSLASKPKPPPSKPSVPDTPKAKPAPKPLEATPPPSSETTPPKSSDEWKEEVDKLRSEFVEFKAQIRKELRQEIQTLSDDLDEERKNNASLKIDIDRLKKMKL